MAKKKAGGVVAAGDGRPEVSAGNTPRPTLASGPLTGSAQGAIFKDDDRLMLVVRVQDAEGAPVTGLKKANFKWWQMGHFFGDVSGFFVVEIDNIPGCEGLYHLVRSQWSTVGNGTIPLFVRVQKGDSRHGGALTFIVKVREGLDL